MNDAIIPNMYVKINDADALSFSSCHGCQQSCCDGGRFVLAPLVLDDFEDVYKNFLIAFAWVDDQLRAVMVISDRKQPCIYYKNNLCTIYDQRPPACVLYPFTPYYDDVLIDTACDAVGAEGFLLKQMQRKVIDQVHPDFYHSRLEYFSDKLDRTYSFLDGVKFHLEPLFEVEGIMLLRYSGSDENRWLKMHEASLEHQKHWI